MFAYENYLPFVAFNESSITFQAAEVFRYGFLVADVSDQDNYRQLYSYHNYYIEVTFNDNYEVIDTIQGITIEEALDKYVDVSVFGDALIEVMC